MQAPSLHDNMKDGDKEQVMITNPAYTSIAHTANVGQTSYITMASICFQNMR